MDARKQIFLLSRNLYLKEIPVIPNFLWIVNRIAFSCDIKPSVDMDKTVNLPHSGLGVVMHKDCKIGSNVTIMQNVTLGANRNKRRVINGEKVVAPYIEDDVFIGSNSVIMGPVKIGKGSTIGAGSVVTKDVPENSTVVGVPAKPIHKK
ncbi:serine O-acetyltransferase [Aerococcus kribbianus]|uniref:Serine acetyltransferase n=1 Tax=Aerococcus kribbianus TaxID=2999064 RepID=A0A9X3JEI5_9LACT|nr:MULTISPECIES: serine acetyltransferase [unclassified Aerococcus]MCZ0717184.1 serine acetyltransferase [Aerococcus sp. YH-aer221]MCZ0725472.1 serine acetyltransferase [Aerococcus sp. YH-aer222]